MEIIVLDTDIEIMYVTATSFPEGILAAHQKLHILIPFTSARRYFGVSRPEKDGSIVYRAGAEQLQSGEAQHVGCETLYLKAGKYISLIIADYLKDLKSIERAFQALLEHPDLDPQGYCVEWYLNEKDVQCMIRLQA